MCTRRRVCSGVVGAHGKIENARNISRPSAEERTKECVLYVCVWKHVYSDVRGVRFTYYGTREKR